MFGISSVLLFLLGVVVAWFTISAALTFLLSVGGNSLATFIAADKYLTLVMLMLVAFGVAFEFPILIVFLLLVRVVNTRQLRHARRWVAVGITVFAAVITPSQDPFSLLLMAIPMYIFYEISIVIGRFMKR
jgi:sec-independent protein translocase protein TatC